MKISASDLRSMRNGWESVEREEIFLLRSMSVQESLNQWLMLQQAFEGQLQQTAELFEAERRKALIELQARLRRLQNP